MPKRREKRRHSPCVDFSLRSDCEKRGAAMGFVVADCEAHRDLAVDALVGLAKPSAAFIRRQAGAGDQGRAPSTAVDRGFPNELALPVMNETVSSGAIAPAA